MGVLMTNGHVANTTVLTAADIGGGGVASLVTEGFPLGVLGFNSMLGNFNRNYAEGTLIYVRGSGQLFSVQLGTFGLCAVLIATLSATAGGAVTGSTLLYVVAPPALALAGSYALPSLALAAIPPLQNSAIIILPGTYTEAATLTIPAGSDISFVGITGSSSLSVTILSTAVGVAVTAQGGKLSFANLKLGSTTSNCLSVVSGTNDIQTDNCTFEAVLLQYSVINTSIGSLAFTAVDTNFLGIFHAGALTGIFDASACTFSKQLTVVEARIKNCTIKEEFTCISDVAISDSFISRTTAGYVILFNPSAPTRVLALTRVVLSNSVAPAMTEPLITTAALGAVVQINQMSVTRDTDPLYSWVSPTHTVVSDTMSAQRLKKEYPAVLLSFDVSKNADIIDVAPSAAGVTATMPDVLYDINGRRVAIRNTSVDRGFFLAPAFGQFIDNQGIPQPVYMPPLGVLELEADRTNALWRRVQPRNAGNVYVVAEDGCAVPNSYPSFAAVQAVIDKDKISRLFVPVIEVHPGTYVGDVTFVYGVTIRGRSTDPTLAIIDGDVSLTADADAVSIENMTVLGNTLLSEATGGNATANNCVFNTIGEAFPALTLASTTINLIRVFDCIIKHDVTEYGIFVNAVGKVDIHHNEIFTQIAISIFVQATDIATITDNILHGGLVFLDTVPVLFRQNRHGVFDSGVAPFVGISCGSGHVIENNLFVPTGKTDVAVASIGSTQTNGLLTVADCAGFTGTAESLRGHRSDRIQEYTALLPLEVMAAVHLFSAGSAGIYVMPLRTVYPQGAQLSFINNSGGIVTLTDGAGTTFVPGGAAVAVIPDQISVILKVDVVGNRWLIISGI